MKPVRRLFRLVDRPRKIRPKTPLKPLAAKLLAVGMAPAQVRR